MLAQLAGGIRDDPVLSPVRVTRVAFPQMLGILLVVGVAAAAITLIYSTTSNQSLRAKSVPVIYQAGADSGASDYVTGLTISTNQTFFTSTVKGVPEATVVIADLVDVSNADARVHTVTLSAPQNTNTMVTAYKIDWFDGATNVGTLDFKAGSPNVTFTNMAAAKVFVGKVTITLAAGAGANNVADPAMAITMTVSA